MSRQGAVLETTGEVPDPPLIAGLMLGVRGWDVNLAEGDDCRLLGYGEFEWRQGGVATVAQCDLTMDRHSGRRHHSAPGPDCNCGLYAFHPWYRWIDRTFRRSGPSGEPSGFRVTGVIQAWGRIELYENGFRAERARPTAILLPRETLDDEERAAFAALARRYRVPALRPTSSHRAQRFAMRRSQISPATVEDLMTGRDLEQTGPEWNRMPELVALPAGPSPWKPASTAAGAALRAIGVAIDATLRFAYFVVMALIGLLLWAFVISLWLPLIGGALYVLWLIASGTFEMVSG